MIDYDRNYLELMGLDEIGIITGSSSLPSKAIPEVLRQMRRPLALALHPDRFKDDPPETRRRAESTLALLFGFLEEVSTETAWAQYRRERFAVLQRRGRVMPREVAYAKRIEDLERTIKDLKKEVDSRDDYISGSASKHELGVLKLRIRDLEDEKTKYQLEIASIRSIHQIELRAAEDLIRRTGKELHRARLEIDELAEKVKTYKRGSANEAGLSSLVDELAELRVIVRKTSNEHYGRLVEQIRLGNTREARETLEKQFQDYDTTREMLILGLYEDAIKNEGSDPERALEDFKRILTMDERHIASFLGAARTAIETNDLQTAKSYAEEALKLNPDSADAHYLGALAAFREHGKEVRDYVRWHLYEAGVRDPRYITKARSIRESLLEEGIDKERILALDQKTIAMDALQRNPNSAEVYYLIAAAQIKIDPKEEDFIRWYSWKAEQLDPAYTDKTKPIRSALGKELA